MPFIVRKDNCFEFPVEVEVPTASGHRTETFTGKFHHHTFEEAQQLFDMSSNDGGKSGANDQEIATRVLAGWAEDVVDADGQPVPYSDETRAELLRDPRVVRAVVTAFGKAIWQSGVQRKN